MPVRGGLWKCGRLLEGSDDFALIGEAVGPGFDFHDFAWVTPAMVAADCTLVERFDIEPFSDFSAK